MVTRLLGRLNKEGVESQSDRHDLISLVQLSTSHCLLSRHTTDPQSLPFKLVPEMERDKYEKNKSRRSVKFLDISVTCKIALGVSKVINLKK